MLSLLKNKEESIASEQEEEKIFGVSTDDLIGAMADVGNNWERVPLRHTEGREGWEDALVGCLKDVGIFIMSSLINYSNSTLACQSSEFPKASGNSYQTIIFT